VADVTRDDRIRDFKTLARSETGKEPVVSIIVAVGSLGDSENEVRFERRIDARRWSDI